jgi:hypothetical protein
MARRIAIELHIVSKASDHVENVSGLTESLRTGQGSRAKKAALLGEIPKRDNAIFRCSSRSVSSTTPRARRMTLSMLGEIGSSNVSSFSKWSVGKNYTQYLTKDPRLAVSEA